jgi:hypothetical protein
MVQVLAFAVCYFSHYFFFTVLLVLLLLFPILVLFSFSLSFLPFLGLILYALL